MFFDDSRPDRKQRALKLEGGSPARQFISSPIPPAKAYQLFTPEEFMNGQDKTLIFDVESVPNYFLVSFKCTKTKKIIYLEDGLYGYIINGFVVTQHQWTSQLVFILNRFLLVGFNSRTY